MNYVKKYNVSSGRPHLQISNESLTKKFDKQVQYGNQSQSNFCDKLLNNLKTTLLKTNSKFNMVANMAAKSHYKALNKFQTFEGSEYFSPDLR